MLATTWSSNDSYQCSIGDTTLEGSIMQFTMHYDGPLRSNGSPLEKHKIRQAFHPQLKLHWQHDPWLSKIADTDITVFNEGTAEESEIEAVKYISMRYSRRGYRFVPLVNGDMSLVCALKIEFFRRSSPGELIRHGGDIDNRLKTLFDALSMPQEDNQIGKDWEPLSDEKPFFCLLENDALITGFCVDTKRLLTPPRIGDGRDDVYLSIEVSVKATQATKHNVGFSLHYS